MHFSNTEDPHATALSVMSPPPLTSVRGMQLQTETAVDFAFVLSLCVDVEGRIEVCGWEGGSWLSWN